MLALVTVKIGREKHRDRAGLGPTGPMPWARSSATGHYRPAPCAAPDFAGRDDPRLSVVPDTSRRMSNNRARRAAQKKTGRLWDIARTSACSDSPKGDPTTARKMGCGGHRHHGRKTVRGTSRACR